jgi:hypothetical protein
VHISSRLTELSLIETAVIQELGREGALPYSAFFASNAPHNAPFAALALQWAMCTFWMVCPPPGDAYNFVLNLHMYPISVTDLFVSGGLLWLYVSPSRDCDWDPPFRAGIPIIIFFLLSNVFLVVAPLIPPAPEFVLYKHLPYWVRAYLQFYAHCLTSLFGRNSCMLGGQWG